MPDIHANDHLYRLLATGLAVASAAAAFRVVRQQYGAAMSAQPKVDRSPSRVALLGIAGLTLLALGGVIISLGEQPLGRDLLLAHFIVAIMIGGVGLALSAGAYYKYGPNRLVQRTEIAGGQFYAVRELLLTACPWPVLGALGTTVTAVLPELNEYVLLIFLMVSAAWILIFQFSPHCLVPAEQVLILKIPSALGLLQDSLVVFAATWFLIAADEWGFDDGVCRLIVCLPPILSVCGALAAKIYELDLTRREVHSQLN